MTPREVANLAYAHLTEGMDSDAIAELDAYLLNPNAARTVAQLRAWGVA